MRGEKKAGPKPRKGLGRNPPTGEGAARGIMSLSFVPVLLDLEKFDISHQTEMNWQTVLRSARCELAATRASAPMFREVHRAPIDDSAIALRASSDGEKKAGPRPC